MQLRRLSIAEFWGLVLDHINEHTEIPVYTTASEHKSPFYYLEFFSTKPVDTKTQFIDRFTFMLHAISKPTNPFTYEPVLDMVKELQEIMTEEVKIGKPFWLINQTYNGLLSLKEDPSHEGHAVLEYQIDISYGFKVK